MNFGETLKKIRRERSMTQEQLAEYLNISTQAVSKWETNLSLPDITLIPMIANIFDISADVLLGIDIPSNEKRIQNIRDQAKAFSDKGYKAKAAEILRDGLIEYPNSYKLMSDLMSCIWMERGHEGESDKTEDDRKTIGKEVIRLGEKILSESTDDECRYNAIQVLCHLYPEIGETEKAVALAKKMPTIWLSADVLLGAIYTGSKRFETKRENILNNTIFSLFLDMTYNAAPLDDGSWPYTREELIEIRMKIIAILKIMFEDQNYGFYEQAMALTYIDMAVFYAAIARYDDAIDSLKSAAEHSIKNDNEYDPDMEYTSLLFRGIKFGGVIHNNTDNNSMHQLDKMKDAAFDKIRQNKEFVLIEERLKESATKR